MKNLFISFSGGETSAYMSLVMRTKLRHLYGEIINVFANTGEENEETLEFVNECDKRFGFNTVWIEAMPQRGRADVTHKIVTFETASRKSEPFEAAINLYGIPNVDFPLCTRELKTRPMQSYIRSIGWGGGEFDTAVGIRSDESERKSKNPGSIIYPLCDIFPVTKPHINTFWRDQPFRLNLAGYQGNCKTCWKKSTRKLLTIMQEAPHHFDFFDRMEKQCSRIGPEFGNLEKYKDGYERSFFRKHLKVVDLRNMLAESDAFESAENDAIIYNDVNYQLDLDDGCVDSCEIDFSQLTSGNIL